MMSVRVCSLIFVATIVLAQSSPVALFRQPLAHGLASGVSHPNPATQGKIVRSYGKLPLSFEANQGQTDAGVKFLSHGSGYTLSLTSDEAVFSLRGSEVNANTPPVGGQLRPSSVISTTNAVLRMKFLHANPAARVKHEGIYSGIDLIYYGNQQQLEFDFVVAPGVAIFSGCRRR